MSKNSNVPEQGVLFDAEEMGRITPNDLWEERDKPVTCLGREFPNDEARREHFREELRKKLPELRKIEGFPIGKDEDIINLSDPPYYTACPNPWLNDFIAEWEKEKLQLEAEGKRKADFEVMEPYASDVSEGKNNPIYMAHSYHTKVPHPAIMRYILHYTQPGDVIFDGFAGTGMTGVAANLCTGNNEYMSAVGHKGEGIRHSICSDLSPVATLIANCYNQIFIPSVFRKKAEDVLAKVEAEYGWMYDTDINGKQGKMNFTIWSDDFICPHCSHEMSFWDAAVDLVGMEIRESFVCPNCSSLLTKKELEKAWKSCYDEVLQEVRKQRKKSPVLINYTLNGKRKENVLSTYDKQILEKIDSIDISKFSTSKFPIGDKTNGIIRANNVEYLHELYTKRAYIYLSRVMELVNGDPYLTAWVTSIIQTASTMYSFRLNRKNGIMKGTLYIPSLMTECNPYFLLKSKIDRFADSWYQGRGNSVICQSSATSINMADKSVDYIFIDPPFGANLMYSELNSIWEGWLKVMTNNEKEAIVNQTQKKTLFDYQALMNASLREFYRILKPGKWMTIEFSNTSASVWNSIQNALQGVGFVIANVASLDKKQGSYNAITSTTAVKQDLVITCYKPSDELSSQFELQVDRKDVVWDFVQEHLEHLAVHIEKGSMTTTIIERSPKILYDRLISYYVQHGLPVPMDTKDFQNGLRERFVERDGMFFTALQAAEYEEKRKHTDGFAPMGIIVSDEANGIEWLKNQLRDIPKTYQQIQPEWMQAINGLRKGDILPELKTLLEENFIEMEDGRWRLPNIQDDVDKNLIRTKALLKEFNLYKEQASKPKAKLKEVRVEALRTGFKQCYIDKDFATIVLVGDKIPQNLRDEDEVLLQFYDIALNKL